MTEPGRTPTLATHANQLVHRDGIRLAQAGLLLNALLAVVKLLAGVVGNSYALIADAVESLFDVLGSVVVWSGLRIASRNPNEAYPFGYGRAEPIAAATTALLLMGAALGISVEAVREIRTPHHAPAPFTLMVLVAVVVVKWLMARRVARLGASSGSAAVNADALHHLGDAATSVAAFIGISVALIKGPGWESADDWAALAAAFVILTTGIRLLSTAVMELMDRTPGEDIVEPVARAARAVPDVRAIEKLALRRAGTAVYVNIHVQADPDMSLHAAHELSGRVKWAIRTAVPAVQGVLVHMEPYHPAGPAGEPIRP